LLEIEGSEFGDDHGIHQSMTLSEFTSCVPIRTYDEFAAYIENIFSGKMNVLTNSDPICFYKTSGTSGKSKYIPATNVWRNKYRGPALYAQW